MTKRLLEIVILCTAALLSMAPGCGCDRNAGGLLLAPTGEKPVPATGSVSGRLAFGSGMFEKSLILMARIKDPTCVSAYNSIKVTGTNTDPIFNVGTAPALTQLAPCVWVDTLTLVSSRIGSSAFRWKFVTNNVFDSPPDYSTANASQIDGLENTLAFAGPGSPDLDADVPGNFLDTPIVCTIDETASPANYKFQLFADAPAAFSSTVDGSFSITSLVPGSYNLRIRPPTGPPVDVMVEVGNTNTDLGTIQIGAPAGSITGAVQFAPTQFPDMAVGPWPPVTVKLLRGTIEVEEFTTSRTDRSFSFTNLPAANYIVRADVNLFGPDSAMATITAGVVVVDTLTLPFAAAELATNMHVAADWNNFTIADSTRMALVLPIVWEYTSAFPIAPGNYNVKFVTDGAIDNPTDYGGNEAVTITVPVTNEPTSLVAGFGTAINIQITAQSTFKFTMDERRQTFTIATVPAPRSIAERNDR